MRPSYFMRRYRMKIAVYKAVQNAGYTLPEKVVSQRFLCNLKLSLLIPKAVTVIPELLCLILVLVS